MAPRALALILGLSILSLPTTAASQTTPPVRSAFGECLFRNGIGYGVFRDGQSPDAAIFPTESQIEEDLAFLSRVTTHVRTYSSRGPFSAIPRLAAPFGLKVMLGVHLEKDPVANEEEIQAALALARSGLVDMLVVGNEILTAGSLSKEELIGYLRRVRRDVPGYVQVSTAEIWDRWRDNLDLAGEVDIVVVHLYPFWEGHTIDGAATVAFDHYDALQRELTRAYPIRDLKMVVGETGWPANGPPVSLPARPSARSQRVFAQEFAAEACARSIPFYLFSAFDEEYKWREGLTQRTDDLRLPENRTLSGAYVGTSWGLFHSNGRLKPEFSDLLEQPHIGTRSHREILVNGRLRALYDMGVDTSGQRRNWLSAPEGELKMAYPSDQDWGAVFATVGPPVDPPRPWKDFSEFATLAIEMRGESGGEAVAIGIKDNQAPDNGSEQKQREILTNEYQWYDFPLSMFASSRMTIPDHLRQLYVVVEFVFEGSQPQTIYVRNVKYK